jgi:hypothetical protein
MQKLIILVVVITLLTVLVSSLPRINYCNVRNPILIVETMDCEVYKLTCIAQGANRFRLWKNTVASGTHTQQIDSFESATFSSITVTGNPAMYLCTAGTVGSDCRPLQAEKIIYPSNCSR